MLARQLTEAEFRQAYFMLFESRQTISECVVHVRGLDQRSLKKAYRRRAQETHPDRAHLRPARSADPDAEFRAVVAAYELLRLVQQGDVEVAAAVVRREARGEVRKEARRPARPTPARPSAKPAHEAPEGERAKARRARREHRNEQPFSAGSNYARWQGHAHETQADARGARADRADAGGRARSARADRSQSEKYPLPERTLQLGQFLYYSNAVSWRQLIDALVWQRRQRPLIGQLALAWGLMTSEQVSEVLSKRRAAGRFDIPFAEYAMQSGYLTHSQHRALIGRAQLMQQRLGRYFVEQGILTEVQLNQFLKTMRLHNWRVRRRAQANGY